MTMYVDTVVDLGVYDDQYNHNCLHIYKGVSNKYYINNTLNDEGVNVYVLDKKYIENVIVMTCLPPLSERGGD
jgi:hypothetical protein